MGTLQQTFEKPETVKKPFLERLFSSPIVRGFYKNEKPAVDVQIEGTGFERRRMTYMINKIANNSPTGRKILEDVAKAGYSFRFDYTPYCYGTCNPDGKVIRLNDRVRDAKLTTTLVHESRHVQQFMRGVPQVLCTYDVATELKLRRAAEADAQAAAAQTALEIRASTKTGLPTSVFISTILW